MTAVMRRTSWWLACALVQGLLTPAVFAQPPVYTVVELELAQAVSSTALDINTSGHVVGRVTMPGGDGAPTRAVVWSDGVLTHLGSLHGNFNTAQGINDDAQVVGWSTYSNFRAFVWSDGIISEIDSAATTAAMAYAINGTGTAVGDLMTGPGSRTTAVRWQNGAMTVLPTLNPCTNCLRNDNARDINASGQIVGRTETPYPRAALWQNGSVTQLGTLGGTNSAAFGINNAGHIVGQAQRSAAAPLYGGTRAFLWKSGVMTDLGTLGDNASFSTAADINAIGQVVGYSTLKDGAHDRTNMRGFLWQNGVMYDLNALTAGSGWTITDATAINDKGQIAATGHRQDGPERALLLNPAGLPPSPQPVHTVYLAEGATSSAFFDTRLALLNPSGLGTLATLTFTPANGQAVTREVKVPGRTRRTVLPRMIPGLEAAEFATRVDSSRPLVVDRTMTWNVSTGYGSHAETAVAAPSSIWYLAEGATHSGFDLFYLIQNPGDTATTVEVSYLLPAPAAPIVKSYMLNPRSRFNIWVNKEGGALASTDVSAIIRSPDGSPVIVERAMYRDSLGQPFGAGHNSAGVTAPLTDWFLAEGATGSYFDLFVLIANPNSSDADVTATYLLPSGQTLTRTYTVNASSRFNIWVDLEDPVLADTAVSMKFASSVPVIVERSMWWPNGSANWMEAHNSPGATVTGTRWALAEGLVGGARTTDTYVLIANTSAFAGEAKVTVILDNDLSVIRAFPLIASSRLNIDVRAEFPEAVNRRFGVLVESVGSTPAQIVVERAMYSNAGGVKWAAGTNALATRLQ